MLILYPFNAPKGLLWYTFNDNDNDDDNHDDNNDVDVDDNHYDNADDDDCDDVDNNNDDNRDDDDNNNDDTDYVPKGLMWSIFNCFLAHESLFLLIRIIIQIVLFWNILYGSKSNSAHLLCLHFLNNA
jgi:hypothetical protein